MQKLFILLVEKRDTSPMLASSSSSPRPMNIGLCVFWWLQLDDKFNIRNVNTSRRNISGDKDLEFVVFEAFEGDFSLILGNITMHHFHIMRDLVREQ